MFDLYYENFEKDHKEAKILYNKLNRTDEETLMFYRLMNKNGEAIDGMKLESASKSYVANPTKMKKLKEYEKEYIKMEKNIIKKKSDFSKDDNNNLNQKALTQIKKIELLDDIHKELDKADKIVDDVNVVLLDNGNNITKNQYRIKLMDQEIILSQEYIIKIKKIDNKSKILYYLTIGFPVLAIVIGLFLKLVLTAKNI